MLLSYQNPWKWLQMHLALKLLGVESFCTRIQDLGGLLDEHDQYIYVLEVTQSFIYLGNVVHKSVRQIIHLMNWPGSRWAQNSTGVFPRRSFVDGNERQMRQWAFLGVRSKFTCLIYIYIMYMKTCTHKLVQSCGNM